jgi:hypothetical protein
VNTAIANLRQGNRPWSTADAGNPGMPFWTRDEQVKHKRRD